MIKRILMLLGLLCCVLSAQNVRKGQLRAGEGQDLIDAPVVHFVNLPTCDSSLEDEYRRVDDCTSDACTAGGGGISKLLVCDDATWEVQGDGGSGGGGAPTDFTYLGLGTNGTLTQERVFTPGNGLGASDGGAGGSYTVSVDLHATGPGLSFTSGDLSLLRICGDNQILKWDSATTSWGCEADVTGSGSGTPDGNDGANQYNDGGNFKADNSVVNVLSFGCAANGSTDDSTCFANAIAGLPTNGGTVICPTGNYEFDTALTITKSGVSIIGPTTQGSPTNQGCTIECNVGSGVDCINVNAHNFKMMGVRMRQDFGATIRTMHAIEIGPGSNFARILDSAFLDFNNAIRFNDGGSGGDASWWTIARNHFQNNVISINEINTASNFPNGSIMDNEFNLREPGDIGIRVRSAQIRIISNKSDGASANDAGDYIFADISAEATAVIANTLERCGGPCIRISDDGFGDHGRESFVAFNFMNGKFDSSTSVGIHIDDAGAGGAPVNNVLIGNVCRGCDTVINDEGSNTFCYGDGCGNYTGNCGSSTTVTVKNGLVTGCS